MIRLGILLATDIEEDTDIALLLTAEIPYMIQSAGWVMGVR